MKIKIKNLALGLGLSAVLLLPNIANATTIHDKKTRSNIASGVSHVKIDRFSDKGWIDIDVLKLDTSNKFSGLAPLIGPNGTSKRATLSTMIDNSNDIVAGVNGDFFDYGKKYPMALGVLHGDDKTLLTTPEEAYKRNAFFIDKNNKGGVGNLKNDITIKNLSKGGGYHINAVNKITVPNPAISLLDSNWGMTSPGKALGANTIELLISNNTVIDKRMGGNGFNIIDGTLVLTQNGDALSTFNIGDKISIDYGSYNNLKFAIGGGNILVKDGKIQDNKAFSKTRAPRTAIGINQNNSEVLLVTVDGRNNSSIGMTELELAEFMRSIGAVNALNLDGGGSTTMAIKESHKENAKVVNNPSGNEERAVLSAVGIKSQAPISEPAYIKIIPSVDRIFLGFPCEIKLEVYDEHHHKLDVNPGDISLTSNLGEFNATNFVPTNKGKGTISANLGEIKETIDIFVHSEIKELNLDKKSLQLEVGQSYKFEKAVGKDDLGYSKNLGIENINFEVIGEIGQMEGSTFKASTENASGYIRASYKDVVRNIPVAIGGETKDIFSFDNHENIDLKNSPEDDTLITSNIEISNENADGNPSTLLNYSVNSSKKSRTANLIFKEAIKLGNSTTIGLSIKGDGNNGKLVAVIKDQYNNREYVSLVDKLNFTEWKYVEAKIPASLKGEKFLEKIYLEIKDDKSFVSQVYFDGLRSRELLALDWQNLEASSSLVDRLNYQVEAPNAKLSITSLDKNSKNESKINYLNTRNVALIYNGTSQEVLNKLNIDQKFNGNDKFNIKSYYNTVFITLDTNSKGLRAANPKQWKPLVDALQNKGEKNFVILSKDNLENIGGPKERDFFFELIDELVAKNRNVFIIYPGSSNSIELKDGYRKVFFDSTGSTNSVLDLNIKDGNLSYLITNLE